MYLKYLVQYRDKVSKLGFSGGSCAVDKTQLSQVVLNVLVLVTFH
jgi:hypothetical protein